MEKHSVVPSEKKYVSVVVVTQIVFKLCICDALMHYAFRAQWAQWAQCHSVQTIRHPSVRDTDTRKSFLRTIDRNIQNYTRIHHCTIYYYYYYRRRKSCEKWPLWKIRQRCCANSNNGYVPIARPSFTYINTRGTKHSLHSWFAYSS